jgi:uncharacterized protein YkwD
VHISLVDPVLVAGFALTVVHAARRSFVPYLTELLAFGIGLWLALYLFDPLGQVVHSRLGISAGVAGFGVFLLLLVIAHGLVQAPVGWAARWVADRMQPNVPPGFYMAVSALPGFGVALMVATVLLCVITVLPFGGLRPMVSGSVLGSAIVSRAGFVESPLQRLLAPPSASAAKRILDSDPASNPGEDAFLKLSLPDDLQTQVDQPGEDVMLQKINQARAQVGLSPLRLDPLLRDAARQHSADMYKRKYFSHKTPDGKTPYDRLHDLRFHYVTAGENLAFAPDGDQAFDSLMKSPDHRANILNPDFRCVGIGALKGLNGYEEMFTQDFADCSS